MRPETPVRKVTLCTPGVAVVVSLVPMMLHRPAARFALVALFVGAAPSRLPGQGAVQRSPNDADVEFMTGMIGHHAQAVLMAGWAKSHGASPRVQEYCRKVVVSQRDEIHLMQHWLEDHHEPLPDSAHPMMMPGMLTAAQLAQLDSARGPDWDRRFLEDMIRHHQGALTMVQQLFNTPGGAQGVVFQFATDISTDQTAEIGRMRQLLLTLP